MSLREQKKILQTPDILSWGQQVSLYGPSCPLKSEVDLLLTAEMFTDLIWLLFAAA